MSPKAHDYAAVTAAEPSGGCQKRLAPAFFLVGCILKNYVFACKLRAQAAGSGPRLLAFDAGGGAGGHGNSGRRVLDLAGVLFPEQVHNVRGHVELDPPAHCVDLRTPATRAAAPPRSSRGRKTPSAAKAP